MYLTAPSETPNTDLQLMVQPVTALAVLRNIDFGTSHRLLSTHGNHTDSPGATRTT